MTPLAACAPLYSTMPVRIATAPFSWNKSKLSREAQRGRRVGRCGLINKLVTQSRQKPAVRVAAILLAITLLGAVLRLVNLSSLPPGAYLDETLPSILARDSV